MRVLSWSSIRNVSDHIFFRISVSEKFEPHLFKFIRSRFCSFVLFKGQQTDVEYPHKSINVFASFPPSSSSHLASPPPCLVCTLYTHTVCVCVHTRMSSLSEEPKERRARGVTKDLFSHCCFNFISSRLPIYTTSAKAIMRLEDTASRQKEAPGFRLWMQFYPGSHLKSVHGLIPDYPRCQWKTALRLWLIF